LNVFPDFIKFNTIFFFGFFFNFLKLELEIDYFGFILLFLAYLVGFMSILILDNRLSFKNIKFIFTFNIFVIIVYFYVTVSNFILFFLFYEALVLPSFLFVYFISPSRRAIQSSIYFVI
jgi:formate hydrogenlyase subunit 3/multisubunit Na+/H+ antiporter MnhD subunit